MLLFARWANRRFLPRSLVAACLLLASATALFIANATPAFAGEDIWKLEGSTHTLLNGANEVLKTWNAREWQTWRKEVQAVGECMGVEEQCAEHEIAGQTPLEALPRATAEYAQEGVKEARKSVGSEVQNALNLAGEAAGTLPTDIGAGKITGASLSAKERVLGVELGNGLDELFEAPEYIPLTEEQKKELSEKYSESIGERLSGFEEPELIALNYQGTIESEPKYTEPPGYYVEGNVYGIWFGIYEYVERCEEGNIFNNCKGLHTVVKQNFEGHLPFRYKVSEHVSVDTDYGGEHTVSIIRYAWGPPDECKEPNVESPGLVGAKGTSSAVGCPPVGVPAPNLITKEIEENNQTVGLTPRPKEKAVTLPSKPPSTLSETYVKQISENKYGREAIEAMFPSKAREEAEVAAKEGELFGAGSEAAPYLSRCHAGGSVNCATGNETQTLPLLSVGGRGPKLDFSLTYNSQLASASKAAAGPYGYGWSGSFSAHTEYNSETGIRTVVLDDGASVSFTKQGSSWVPVSPGLTQATLAEEGETFVLTLPDQTKLHFNAAGNLASEEDRDGNKLTMSRGTEERLESVSDEAGRKLSFAYNAEGVEAITDPMGHKVKLTHEGGNLSTITLPGEEKARWSFKYDAEHELNSETDGRGNTTEREYKEHKVISETDPLKRKRAWKYAITETGSETTITEPNGSTTVEKFNEAGSPTSVTRAHGTSIAATSKTEYNGLDERIAYIDPNNHKTELAYDEAGDKTSEKNPDGDETKWEYNKTHDVISETTPTGEKTTIEREAKGNPTKISRPAPKETTQVSEYKWSSKGDEESYTDPLKRTWKYEVDTYGDRSAEIDPLANKRTWGYDEDSHVTSTVSPRGHVKAGEEAKYTTKIERDAQERLITITDPLGHTTKIHRDGNGNVETVTDGNSHTTTLGWDADNEQASTKEANGDTRETEYDAAGQVVAQIDGNKHKTKYERNLLEEVTEEIDPLGHKTLKEYDKAGNLEKLTDAEKRVTTIKHDSANLITEISYSDGKTHSVELGYDKDGQRTKMVDGTGTTTIERDSLERPIKVTDGHGDSVSYEWDLANENTKLTYPNGKAVERKFDGAGRLEKVIDWLGNTTTFGWNQDSYLTTATFPTVTKDADTTTLNEADQITKTEMKKGTEVLASLAYTRDNDGQVKTITQKKLPGGEKPEVALDENNRLTKYGTNELKYDAANDLTKVAGATQTFNEASELEKAGTTSFTYAEAGERTKATPEKGPATSFGYNQAQDLTSVERPEGEGKAKIEDSFVSNGDGLRASETINGATSYLTWDATEGSMPLLLSNGTYGFVYGPAGLPVEQISTKEGKEQAQYLHHDQQGSTRLITGGAGTVEGKCSYAAYGAPTCEGTATTPLDFDGQYTSSDTGLIYLRMRVYDPATAQFLSRDPLAIYTGGPYFYAGDNPLNYGDPSGLSSEGVSEGFSCPNPVCFPFPNHQEVKHGTEAIEGVAHEVAHEVSSAWNAVFSEGSSNESAQSEPAEAGNACDTTIEPTPPGYDPDTWTKGPASRAKEPGENYYDPEGAEWHYHAPDKYHPNAHWDRKAPTPWNAEWEEIPIP